MIESEKLKGFQDKKLELGKKTGHSFENKSRMTPTKDSDISPRAYAYMRLRDGLVLGLIELEGCRGDTKSPFYAQAQDQIDMVKDEARAFGFEYSTLELVAKTAIQKMKDEEAQIEFEEQASLGEVPIVDFKSDAGGFEMRKRGW